MKQAIVAFSLGAVLLAPASVWGGDLEDLKAAMEGLYSALHQRDAEGIVETYHEQYVCFTGNGVFPQDWVTRSKEERVQYYEKVFANYENYTVALINPQYRVAGNTGIVWGHHRSVRKPKDGPRETSTRRFTRTWVKSGGKWLMLASHRSAVPSGS
jgi:ketosteroid isomerase-like protein